MSLKALRTIVVDDRAVSQFQDNVVAWVAQLLGVDVVDGVRLDGVVLANGLTTVNHTLGRAPSGMLVFSQSAAAAIWFNKTESTLPKLTAIVHSNAVVTADLYFFGG